MLDKARSSVARSVPYPSRMTGLSLPQTARLIQMYIETGTIEPRGYGGISSPTSTPTAMWICLAWDLSRLRESDQREAIAGCAVGGVVPTLPGKIGPNGGRSPWR